MLVTKFSFSETQAVILCGGMGTRLREETEYRPKPMVEIGGLPILWHIMKIYSSFGVRDFLLCLGYKGDVIRDYFLNYKLRNVDFSVELKSGTVETLSPGHEEDWRVLLADTGLESLTGRRVQQILPYIKAERFLVTYGDGLSDVNLDNLMVQHLKSGKLATVTAVHPNSRFGELSIDGGTVTSFAEKPQVESGWINGGFMVIEKSAFLERDFPQNFTLESDLLERLAKEKQLGVYTHQGFWQCMDTFRESQLLNEMWSEGRAPWRAW